MCRPPSASQTQIIPAGNVKIGSYQYVVKLNNAADTIESLNDLPVKTVDGATVFMRDVAHVRDGNPPQSNVVHVDGGRAVLATVLKNGAASTLDVVQGIKDMLPLLKQPAAGFPQDRPAERPVHFRQSGDFRRGARRRHGGGCSPA